MWIGIDIVQSYHRERMTEQHQQLVQNLLPHLALELEQPIEAEEHPNTQSTSIVMQLSVTINKVHTYSATEARSLEMSLVFLKSLQRVTRAAQNG